MELLCGKEVDKRDKVETKKIFRDLMDYVILK
jgi:hypothetical protein